jgi:hypothetical protein
MYTFSCIPHSVANVVTVLFTLVITFLADYTEEVDMNVGDLLKASAGLEGGKAGTAGPQPSSWRHLMNPWTLGLRVPLHRLPWCHELVHRLLVHPPRLRAAGRFVGFALCASDASSRCGRLPPAGADRHQPMHD